MGCAPEITADPTTTTAQPTADSTLSSATSTSSTNLKTPSWALPPVCPEACDEPFEVLFEVPVGNEGIGYANVDEVEIESYGPSSLAITPAGDVWIADVVNERLHRFGRDGTLLTSIGVEEFEIAIPIDLAAADQGLLILDVYPPTSRYRVVQLDRDDNLQTILSLPEGLWLEDGLTGVAWGTNDQIWIELETGNQVAMLDASDPAAPFEVSNGYPYPNGSFTRQPDDPFSFLAGSGRVSVETNAELGGLTLIGVNEDGSFVLQLDEVGQAEDGSFVVDESVHLFDHHGGHIGSASFPLGEQFLFVERPLALGPDGFVYGLVTARDLVKVVRLNYAR